jgi:hypothetical protein
MLRTVLFRLWPLDLRGYRGGRSYRLRIGGQGGTFQLGEPNYADGAEVGMLLSRPLRGIEEPRRRRRGKSTSYGNTMTKGEIEAVTRRPR